MFGSIIQYNGFGAGFSFHYFVPTFIGSFFRWHLIKKCTFSIISFFHEVAYISWIIYHRTVSKGILFKVIFSIFLKGLVWKISTVIRLSLVLKILLVIDVIDGYEYEVKVNDHVTFTSIYKFGLSVCLFVCLFVCLYPINVKTAEPIGAKFFVGHLGTPGKVYEKSKFQIFVSIKIRSSLNF